MIAVLPPSGLSHRNVFLGPSSLLERGGGGLCVSQGVGVRGCREDLSICCFLVQGFSHNCKQQENAL